MLITRAMLSTEKALFLSFITLFLTSAAFADNPASATVFGLPTSMARNSIPATGITQSVGSLTYSNQWIQEKNTSYLYVSYNSASLANSTLTENQYTTDFGSKAYAYPTVDLFSHLFSFADSESKSGARDFSVWGRYSLGFASRKGLINSDATAIDSSVTSDSLVILNSRIGVLLGFDRLSWFRPYIGIEIDPYLYRNTADITGAEQQGGNMTYGPVLGAHFPLFFSGRGSLLGEYRRNIAASGTGQLFVNANSFATGMGLAF